MQAGYVRIAEASVRASCAAKGIPLGTPAEGEEWVGPWCVVRHLRLIIASLTALDRAGNTPVGRIGRTDDDRLTVRVFPASSVDGMLFSGITVDVHLQPHIGEAEMHASRAAFYKGAGHAGRTVLVLGAGNVNAIPGMDVLSKLFNEGKVCLLKMNPVNAYLGPFIEEAFAEPIARGFLGVAYGGAEEGAYLAQHSGIDEIHLTGSDRTYDTLVWGPPGPEREQRKATGVPVLTKPVTAELGNVSPVLVVPGPYSEKELASQAEAIAGGVVNNASFNCNAAKIIVSPGRWQHRKALLAGIERVLAATPTRLAYYPGAQERWRKLTGGRDGVRTIGDPTEGQLPWTLMPGLEAVDAAEPAFATEPFCSVISETEVGSEDPLEYLERAVTFANDRLWGTLTATLVVHPKTMRDPVLGPAVERAIGRLRYGAVAVNAWTGLIFAFATPPWGAYPGSTPGDIQSGTGWVHNTPMLEGIEKAVMRHPLTMMPKPATFPSHRTAHTLLRRITYLEETGGWSKVPGVVAAAMRG
jgi:aldehyde dehydrogenase (NAD(P)+)